MITENPNNSLDLTVVVPVFDEVGNVGPLLDELGTSLDPLDIDYEMIFVDDGSTDGTLETLRRRADDLPRLRVIRLAGRHGQTAALQAGFDFARGEVIATMDGDLQNDPQDLPRFLDVLDQGYDAVAGWRRHRRDALLHRRIPSWLAHGLVWLVTGRRFRDLGCGIKAFRRNTAERLRLTSELHRFIPLVMALDGSRCAEIEVHHRPRTWGKSKYGLERTWQVLLDLGLVLLMAWARRLERNADTATTERDGDEAIDDSTIDPLATGSWTRHTVDRLTESVHRPLQVYGRLGIALWLVAGLAVAATGAYRDALDASWTQGLLITAGLTAVAGIVCLGLGFVGELARSRRHRKPQYTIGVLLGDDRRRIAPEARS